MDTRSGRCRFPAATVMMSTLPQSSHPHRLVANAGRRGYSAGCSVDWRGWRGGAVIIMYTYHHIQPTSPTCLQSCRRPNRDARLWRRRLHAVGRRRGRRGSAVLSLAFVSVGSCNWTEYEDEVYEDREGHTTTQRSSLSAHRYSHLHLFAPHSPAHTSSWLLCSRGGLGSFFQVSGVHPAHHGAECSPGTHLTLVVWSPTSQS